MVDDFNGCGVFQTMGNRDNTLPYNKLQGTLLEKSFKNIIIN